MVRSRRRPLVLAVALVLSACGGGGSAGESPSPECAAPADCPGSDTECATRTCVAGACGVAYAPAGTALASQTPGDCRVVECDGAGETRSAVDDADVPEDGNACTEDACTAGVPSNAFASAGTACSQDGGTQCDGAGSCAQCLVASDCPGSDAECATRTCTAGACGVAYARAGTALAAQTPGDCRVAECDGAGEARSVADDADVPVDGNACTRDVCTGGIPSNPNATAGAACAQNGGTLCDGSGLCVECLGASDCAGSDTECRTRTCTAGLCGATYAAEGTALASQAAGDCRLVECDGAGGTRSVADDADVPVDGKQCTDDTCTAGVASNPNVAAHAACNQDGGLVCDGNGACVECASGSDCASLVCVSGACQPPTCSDSVKNADETDVDCGGTCGATCGVLQACLANADCRSGYCTGNLCRRPAPIFASPTGQGVSVSTPILVTFSTAMDPASLASQAVDGPCTGAFQLSRDGFATCVATSDPAVASEGKAFTWTPSVPLAPGTRYGFQIKGSAHTPGGEPLGSDLTGWGFTTLAPAGAVVISQVYGGGQTSTAWYQNDFVELHNRSAAPVSVEGWSVQYASSTGTTWQYTILHGAIPAGGYYLVSEAGGATGSPLPVPPDATGVIPMSSTAGKVALVEYTYALTGCPAGAPLRDLVAYGAATTCAEARPAPDLAPTLAVLRGGWGCTDTDDNSADLMVGAPAPRNTASPAVPCAGLPAEVAFCNLQWPASLAVRAGAITPPVYGRLYEVGLTEAAGRPAGVLAQLGYGPAATDPRVDSEWSFVDASYNTQVGSDDEYVADVTAPAAGVWSYAFRFSLDGATWTYCDLDGAGSGAGLTFDLSQLGVMTVTP